MNSNYAVAKVTCRDGRVCDFVGTIDGLCFHYEGRKHTYLLWDEPEGRGFVVMMPVRDRFGNRTYAAAPSKWQPRKIEVKSRVSSWKWEVIE